MFAMKKEKVEVQSRKLIGISVRTNNKNEMNPETAQIGKAAYAYRSEQMANQFHGRKNPGVSYRVYTDFESDENGDYTYFIGEEVDLEANRELLAASTFQSREIPAGSYQKFTTPAGVMPQVVIHAWKQIWAMPASEWPEKRRYLADFEVHDQRAADPSNAIIDIYIGVVE